MSAPEGYPDQVGLLEDGWAVRFEGCIQTPRWRTKGGAEAQLELLQKGVRKPEPEARAATPFERSIL